jgi:hypothetical protein
MASSNVKDQREEVATIGTYTPPQSAKRNAITAIAVGADWWSELWTLHKL